MMQFVSLDKDIQELLTLAVTAHGRAYCPYSKFKVGACLLTEEGERVTGCNVENASFTVGTCAERCALAKAISEGLSGKWKACAIIGDLPEPTICTPCGACRQMLVEFAVDNNAKLYMTTSQLGQVQVATIQELQPFAFTGF